MKYQAPYGVSDPNAGYINGNPPAGIEGSIPPAAAFEEPMREIVAVISNSGITPDDGDLAQMAKGIRSQYMNYAVDTGSVDYVSVSMTPPLTSYTVGLVLRVLIHASNDGPATIDGGCGRVPIKRTNGLPLALGDLPAGGVVEMVYDGSAFQLVNFFGSSTGSGGGGGTITFNSLPYCVDSSITPNVINAAFSPAITTMPAGTAFLVKVANDTNGPTVVNVNANANVPVRVNGHGVVGPRDIAAGDVKLFVYDGTYLWMDASVRSPSIGHGRCYLSLSGGNLLLAPENGNGLIINGVLYSLPQGGVQLTPTGLAANTFYYIYAQITSIAGAPAIQLIPSATGHLQDAGGVEVMSGGAMNTLVGAVMTNAIGQFVDQDGQLYVLSWFNRKRKRSRTSFNVNHTTTAGNYIELGTEIRNYFLQWGGALSLFSGTGCVRCDGGSIAYTAIAFDGGGVGNYEMETVAGGNGSVGNNDYTPSVFSGWKKGLSEGAHWATLLGFVGSGPRSGTWAGASAPGLQIVISTISIIGEG